MASTEKNIVVSWGDKRIIINPIDQKTNIINSKRFVALSNTCSQRHDLFLFLYFYFLGQL